MNFNIIFGIFLGVISIINVAVGIYNLPTKYFVSYIYENGKNTGYSNCEITLYRNNTLEEAQESIRKKNEYDKIVILNKIKL